VESGSCNPIATTKDRHSQCKTKYCGVLRSSSTSSCYAHAAFAARTVDHLLHRWMNAFGAAKCPPAYTPKLGTTRTETANTRHIQHRCRSCVKLMSFLR
jgi:hypothetical protein